MAQYTIFGAGLESTSVIRLDPVVVAQGDPYINRTNLDTAVVRPAGIHAGEASGMAATVDGDETLVLGVTTDDNQSFLVEINHPASGLDVTLTILAGANAMRLSNGMEIGPQAIAFTAVV